MDRNMAYFNHEEMKLTRGYNRQRFLCETLPIYVRVDTVARDSCEWLQNQTQVSHFMWYELHKANYWFVEVFCVRTLYHFV